MVRVVRSTTSVDAREKATRKLTTAAALRVAASEAIFASISRGFSSFVEYIGAENA